MGVVCNIIHILAVSSLNPYFLYPELPTQRNFPSMDIMKLLRIFLYLSLNTPVLARIWADPHTCSNFAHDQGYDSADTLFTDMWEVMTQISRQALYRLENINNGAVYADYEGWELYRLFATYKAFFPDIENARHVNTVYSELALCISCMRLRFCLSVRLTQHLVFW
jgi:hypothetical protein